MKYFWMACLLLFACVETPAEPIETVARTSIHEPVSNTYIVRFSDNEPNVVGKVSSILRQYNTAKQVFVYKNTIKGMAIQTTDSIINLIANDSAVVSVETDGFARTNQSWGLDRIDQQYLPLDLTYAYPNSGNNVTAYILDTGIQSSNSEFIGRVLSGKNFTDTTSSTEDCNGHGTHVAGIVGGTTYGVAKQIKLIPVRVLNCSGSGSWSGVIAGLDWAAGSFTKPAVMNMSIGGSYNQSVNAAVSAAIAKGLVISVAAGNSAADACSYSPSSTPDAITVGATDSNDGFASFSNYGLCVDILAPGVAIPSSYLNNNIAILSGTSMASPFVAGVTALILNGNPQATPKQIRTELLSKATQGVIQFVPTNTTNLLLYNTNTLGFATLPLSPMLPKVVITKSCTSFTCVLDGSTSSGTGTLTYAWAVTNGQTASTSKITVSFIQKNASYTAKLKVSDTNGISVDSIKISCNTKGKTIGCK